MARLPQVNREDVPEELRAAFDEVDVGPAGGAGPMSVLKNSPEMARRTVPLFNYVRNESTLPQKVKELAMLTAARAMDCQYIWNAHVTLGRQAGLSDKLVDALRDRQQLPQLAEDEAAVVSLGQEFFTTHRVSQATFDLGLGLFGAQGVIELTMLMGFYAMLAFTANAVDLGLPHSQAEPPLPV